MKKTYINPSLEVVKIKAESIMQSVSADPNSSFGNEEEVGARGVNADGDLWED